MKVMTIVGARPNFMKVAPIIAAIRRHNEIRGIEELASDRAQSFPRADRNRRMWKAVETVCFIPILGQKDRLYLAAKRSEAPRIGIRARKSTLAACRSLSALSLM